MNTIPDVESLKTTEWLARRLGLSVTTIERLRAKSSPAIPPHIKVGNSIRYSEEYVEQWIKQLMCAVDHVQNQMKEAGHD